jgi:hypothetical protein
MQALVRKNELTSIGAQAHFVDGSILKQGIKMH